MKWISLGESDNKWQPQSCRRPDGMTGTPSVKKVISFHGRFWEGERKPCPIFPSTDTQDQVGIWRSGRFFDSPSKCHKSVNLTCSAQSPNWNLKFVFVSMKYAIPSIATTLSVSCVNSRTE